VARQVLQLARGDFSSRLAVPNRDELGELAVRVKRQ